MIPILLLPLLPGATAAPPVLNLVPFGVGVYLHDRPGRGVMYSTTQAAGAAGLAISAVMARQAGEADDVERVEQLGVVTSLSVTMLVASYFVSVLDGGRLHELEVKNATASVRSWDDAVRRAAPPSGPDGG